jgi:hypothetical protein
MSRTGFDERYTDYQSNRSRLRKIVRRAYLRSACSLIEGPTLDFGCGVGELLARLPSGSKGLEYNKATVEHCRRNGLDVDWYDGELDDWRLTVIPEDRRFDSMVISHVLEHMTAPIDILNHLLSSAKRFGISHVLVIVPGPAGYRIDDTHRTFIDRSMLSDRAVVRGTGFQQPRSRYFPGNVRALGDWFAHHELQALFVRK